MQTYTYTPEMIGTLPNENGQGAKRPQVNVLGRPYQWPPINRHMIGNRQYVVLPDVITEPYEVKTTETPVAFPRRMRGSDDAS